MPFPSAQQQHGPMFPFGHTTIWPFLSDIRPPDFQKAAFTTADGRLNESMDVVLYTNHSIGDGAFTADLTTTEGTLEISDFATESFDTLTASLDATWNENGIMGSIDGFGETTDGSAVSMSRFDIASFGATGF